MSYTYLASPYTHSDPYVMERRYSEALDCLHWLLKHRIWTYSPIVHCHELAIRHRLRRDSTFWREYNFTMLRGANRLLILTLDGWLESAGIGEERDFATGANLSINFITPTTYKITKTHKGPQR